MRVLLIDTEGDGQFLDFALRCVEYGHEVRIWRALIKGRVTRDGEG